MGLLNNQDEQMQPPQQQMPPHPEQDGDERGGPPDNDGDEIKTKQEKSGKISQLMALHIYNNADSTIKIIETAQNKGEAAGKLIGQLLMFSGIQAKEAGAQLEPPVLFKAAVDATRVLGELLVKRGVIAAEEENALMNEAFHLGGNIFVKNAGLSDQERQHYASIYQQFMQVTSKGGQNVPTR